MCATGHFLKSRNDANYPTEYRMDKIFVDFLPDAPGRAAARSPRGNCIHDNFFGDFCPAPVFSKAESSRL